MNTKTIFKKPRVIITAVVLALIVALTAVVVILASEKATFKGVQVATDGYINLRFHYTINDESVTKANVYIDDADAGTTSMVVDLTVDGDDTYFTVPLAAAQMGCDVTVVPLDELGNEISAKGSTNAPTWSVKDYADKVLADSTQYSEYVAGLKAIVNYGHYASEYFTVGNDVVENEGIYGRKTNPIIGMTKLLKAGEGPKWTVADEYANVISVEKITVALEDSVSIKLYYTYTGDSVTTGTHIEGDRYYVSIDNIGANQYTTDYSAYLKVQVGGYTAVTVENANVISCLEKLVGSEDVKLQNLALALYNFYHWTSSSVDRAEATCSHFMHYEYVAEGVTQPVCTYCGKIVNYQVSDEINYFSAPGQLVNNWATDNVADATGTANRFMLTNVQSENGVDFTRVYVNGNGTMMMANGTVGFGADGYNLNTEGTSQNLLMDGQGVGRYVVLKVRTPNITSLRIGVAGGYNFGNNTRPASTATEMGTNEFVIYVIDLQGKSEVKPNATTFNMVFGGQKADVSGAYMDVAYFAICDNIDEVKQLTVGESKAITTDLAWTTPKNDVVDVLEGHTDHSSMVLASVKTDSNRNNTYNYTCTNLCCDEATSKTVSGDVNYYSAPGQFVNHWNASSEPGSLTNFTHVEKTVLPHVSVDPDGTVYTRVYFKTEGQTQGRVYMSNGTAVAPNDYRGGTDNSPKVVDKLNTNADGTTQGTGKYLVVKIRLSETIGSAKDVRLEIATDKTGTVTYNKYRWISNTTDFATLVVDLVGIADDSAEKINIKIRYPGTGVQYYDIAYFALCDNWDEIANIVGSGTVRHMPDWANTSDGTIQNYDGTCVNGCAERVITAQDFSNSSTTVCYESVTTTYKCSNESCPNYIKVKTENRVAHDHTAMGLASASQSQYIYGCTNEGCVAEPQKTVTIPESLNYYYAPGQAIVSYKTGEVSGTALADLKPLTKVSVEGDTVYQRIFMGKYGMAFLGGGEAIGSYGHLQAGTIKEPKKVDPLNGGMGKYIVLKLRVGETFGNIALQIVTDKAPTQSEGIYVASREIHPNAVEMQCKDAQGFVTYVLDASKIASVDASYINVMIGNQSGLDVLGDVTPYIDVAYFAVCNSWNDIKAIAGADTDVFSLSTWNGAGVVLNSDGTCTSHLVGVPTVNGNEYTYTCNTCKDTYTVVKPENTNFYATPGYVVNLWAASNNMLTKLDANGSPTGYNSAGVVMNNIRVDENGVYTRVYVGKSAIVAVGNGTTASQADGTAKDALTNGMGRYVVLKLRSHGNDDEGIRIGIHTAKGGTTNKTYYTYSGSWRQDPDRFQDNEFTTFIIDLGTVISDSDTIQIRIGTDSYESQYGTNSADDIKLGAYVDIAYAAVCNSYDTVAQVVANETKVLYTTSWTNLNSQTEITKAAHETETQKVSFVGKSTGADGNTTYKYQCQNFFCTGHEKTANDIAFFSAPGQMYNNCNTGNYNGDTTDPYSSTKQLTDLYMDPDGTIYTRVHLPNGKTATSAFCANGTETTLAQGGGANAQGSLNGKNFGYAVFKIRNNGASGVNVGIYTNDTDCKQLVGIGGAVRLASACEDLTDGEFHIYVMDYSTCGTLDSETAATLLVGGPGSTAVAGENISIDVAYAAVCSTLQEVSDLIGDDDSTIFFGTNFWNSNNSTYPAGYGGDLTKDEFEVLVKLK